MHFSDRGRAGLTPAARAARYRQLATEADRRSESSAEDVRTADAPLERVGEDLRKARQRRGEDLADISRVLKIRPHYLIAVEENRFEALPGRVYAIGFVRSYAAYLGLDAGDFVDRLKAEMDGHDDGKEPEADGPLPLPERKLPQGGRVITGLVLAGLIYSGYYLFASAGPTLQPRVAPVPERLAALAAPAPEPIAAPALATVEQAAPMLPLPEQIEVSSAQVFSLPSEPAPGAETPLPPGRRYGVQNRNSRITLRVHRPTHVAVQGTRNRVFVDRTLAAGDTYRVPNIVGLRLSTPDAGALEVILDGSPIGFAGRDGVTARGLSLNPQNIIDRRQRG